MIFNIAGYYTQVGIGFYYSPEYYKLLKQKVETEILSNIKTDAI